MNDKKTEPNHKCEVCGDEWRGRVGAFTVVCPACGVSGYHSIPDKKTEPQSASEPSEIVELAEILAWIRARKSAQHYLTHEEAAVCVHAYTNSLRQSLSALQAERDQLEKMVVKAWEPMRDEELTQVYDVIHAIFRLTATPEGMLLIRAKHYTEKLLTERESQLRVAREALEKIATFKATADNPFYAVRTIRAIKGIAADSLDELARKAMEATK